MEKRAKSSSKADTPATKRASSNEVTSEAVASAAQALASKKRDVTLSAIIKHLAKEQKGDGKKIKSTMLKKLTVSVTSDGKITLNAP